MSQARSVLLAGATGLVGRECLRLLLDDPGVGRVVAITRRPLPADARLHRRAASALDEHLIDFDRLASYDRLPRLDQIVCALGTTIRQAGSRDRFRLVDHEYPLLLARRGLELGARHYLLVSSLGADARSTVFYSRVKGETEDAIRELPFRSITIVRPSLLLGDRSESRLGEEVAKRLGFLMPRRYKPVHARDVAAALVDAARIGSPGVRIIESGEIPRGA